MLFGDLIYRVVDYAAMHHTSDTERNRPGSNWIETDATVTECRVYYRARAGRDPAVGIPMPYHIVKFTYQANGRRCNGKFRSANPYNVGDEFKLSYDPIHPNKNTANQRRWPQIIVVWCVVIGSVLLAFWWKTR